VPALIELVRKYKNSDPGDVKSRSVLRTASEALKAADKNAAAKDGI
jgi:hypothetical protein